MEINIVEIEKVKNNYLANRKAMSEQSANLCDWMSNEYVKAIPLLSPTVKEIFTRYKISKVKYYTVSESLLFRLSLINPELTKLMISGELFEIQPDIVLRFNIDDVGTIDMKSELTGEFKSIISGRIDNYRYCVKNGKENVQSCIKSLSHNREQLRKDETNLQYFENILDNIDKS